MEPLLVGVHPAYMPKGTRLSQKSTPFRITKIRKWRETRDKTLEEVAAVLGITHATLSRIERGLLPYSQEHLERLSKELNIDVASLLGRDPDDPETIWPLWNQATGEQKEMIVDIAKSIVKSR
jgi:transcriptional regulator with XRE-family HTH domain